MVNNKLTLFDDRPRWSSSLKQKEKYVCDSKVNHHDLFDMSNNNIPSDDIIFALDLQCFYLFYICSQLLNILKSKSQISKIVFKRIFKCF